jgi:pseudouridine synthase
MAKIRSGVTDDGEFLKPVSVERKKRGNGEHLVFILAEGKKREIRRLVAAAGAKVQCLRRVAVGKLELGKLPTGKWRRLSGKEARTAAKPLA